MGELKIKELDSNEKSLILVALAGPQEVGRFHGVFLDKRTCFVKKISCAEGRPCSVVEDAIFGYIASEFSRDGIGVFSSDRPKNAEVNSALERAGFEIEKRKALVSRSLKAELPVPETTFSFRTLADVGKDEFLRVMTEAAEGDPFEDESDRDPKEDFQELKNGAGEKFDPASWMLARVDDEAVGVVLPQVFPDKDDEGTLFYVAVLPAFRGRGYGRALHAAGLAMLAERGVTRYIGSTDMRNAPMLKIFEANGCEQTSTQFFYRPPAAE